MGLSQLRSVEQIDLPSAVVRKGRETLDRQRIGDRPCDAFRRGGLFLEMLKPGHVPSPCNDGGTI